MGFFQKLLSDTASSLGFGKNTKGIGGFLNKAKNFIGSGLSALNSKTGKGIVNAITQYAPSVGAAVGSLKKYGNIAQNILGDAAEKKGERYIKQSPILMQMDRWDQPTKPAKFHTIEKVRKRDPDDEEMGLNSIFA